MATLTVFEYGLNGSSLSVGDRFSSENRTITHKDANTLELLCKRFKVDVFKYVNSKTLNAQQFVGVIQLGNNAIEVLPKIDGLSVQGVRKNLVSMLAATRKLEIKGADIAKLATQNLDFLEIIIRLFCDKFFEQLHKGLIRRYETRQENLNVVKGKILTTINARLNLLNPERLFCEFDEFQEDNPINRIFKAAFKFLLKVSKDGRNQTKLSELLFALDGVTTTPVDKLDWHKVVIDRQSKRYELLYSLAKLFLKRKSTDVTSAQQSGYSLLFDMNELFEEYIGEQCRKVFRSHNVRLQGPESYLLTDIATNRPVFMTKPDVTIKSNNGEIWIIDTKWKVLDVNKSKDGVQQQDIYQMFAYAKTYACSDVYLLYPYHPNLFSKPGISKTFKINCDDQKYRIHVSTIDIQNLGDVSAQLLNLISDSPKDIKVAASYTSQQRVEAVQFIVL